MSYRSACVVALFVAFRLGGATASIATAATADDLTHVVVSQPNSAELTRVDSLTGVLRLSCVDLRVPAGAVALTVERVYEADAGAAGLLGRSWRLNWEQRLTRNDRLAGIRQAGGTLLFRREGNGETYRASQGNELVFSGDGAVHALPNGRREQYDARGRLISVDARNGNLIRVEYDDAGRLTQVTGPFGSFLKFTIDGRGRIARVEGSNSAVARYFYADEKPPADLQGRRTSYAYDDGYRLTSVENPQSGVERFTYDAYGRVTERRYADDAVERFAYDEAEHTVKRTDAGGETSILREATDGSSVELTTAGGARSRVEFDTRRRPVAAIGPTGLVVRWTYDDQGRTTQIESPATGAYAFAYRGESRELAAVAVPDGRRLDISYDDRRNVTHAQFDGNPPAEFEVTYRPDGLPESVGRRGEPRLALAYDDHGRLQSVIDGLGRHGDFEYDDAGRWTRYVDAAGGAVARSYDDAGRLASFTSAVGGVTKFEYDAAGRLAKRFDPLGGATSFEFDARGRVIGRTDPLGRAVRYAYHPDGRLRSETDASGSMTRYEFDADGRPARRTNAAGGTMRYQFDLLGNPTSVQFATGATLKATYDELGRRTEITDPTGNVVRYEYDRLGRVVEQTDPDGGTTRYEYDGRGNPVKATYPSGRVVARKYDSADRVVEITIDDRPRATYEYDAGGDVSRIKYAAGLEVTYKYDALGRRSEWQDNVGGKGKIVRDAEGRPIEQIDATGAIVRRRFDAAGRLVETTDALGRAETYSYDAAGQLIQTAAANGDAAKVDYDADGRIIKVRAPGGGERTYQYDSLGSPIRATNPLGQVARCTYDSAGRLVTSTDAAGRTTTFVYGAVGRLAERRRSDGSSVRYRYDERGRIAEIDDGAFPVRYAYDDQGRRTSVEYPTLKQKIVYGYARDRLDSVAAGGRTVRYKYDELDRLTEIDVGGGAIRFSYDPRGRRTSIEYPNGVKAVREFDAAGRVKKLVYTNRVGQPISGGEYVYDPTGNEIETIEVGGAVTIYGYDAAGQLLSEDRGAKGRTSYAYTPGGNRSHRNRGGQAIAYEYDQADRLMKAGDETLQYDDADRLVERKSPAGTTVYEYDADGRLSGVTVPAGDKITYGYAPTGERIWRETEGKRTWYLTDGFEVLAELDAGMNVQATFVHGPGIDDLLAMTYDDRTLYVHPDRRGSVRSLTDADAKPSATFEYDAFGQIVGKSGDVANSFAFTGREFDEATGLYYFRARWYDPGLGRFLTKDPIPGSIVEPLSLNPYQYVANNPLRSIDPLGTEGVNPNVTMDSPQITMDSPAVTMDTPPGATPTITVAPELATTMEVPIGPAVTMDTPAPASTTYQDWWRGGGRGPEPVSPFLEQWRARIGGGPVGNPHDSIIYRDQQSLSRHIRGAESHVRNVRINYEQERAVFERARRPLDEGTRIFWDTILDQVENDLARVTDEANRRVQGLPAADSFFEGLRNYETETARMMSEQGITPSPAAPEPVPPAPAERPGLWSRVGQSVRGAYDAFMEPKATIGGVVGGVAAGGLVAGNVLVDVVGEEKSLGESLLNQGVGLLVGIPVMIVASATGTGELVLIAAIGHTVKRGYDALSGDATVELGDKARRRDDQPSTAGAQSTTAGNTGPPQVPARRPLTPREMADLNQYLQGLTAPGGAQLVAVPSVLGYPAPAAIPMLTQAGLAGKPLVGKEAPTEKQQFQVYYQKPDAGTLVVAGTTVEVMFYNKAGPTKETVKVPNLVGLTKTEAEAALAKVKLTANGTPGKERPPASSKPQQVFSQNPKADAEVFAGDAVKFEYYAGIPVGNYIGMHKDKATQEITALGLMPQVNTGGKTAPKASERFNICDQMPKAGEFLNLGETVVIEMYQFSGGFLDGDGKLVHPELAEAKVSDYGIRRSVLFLSVEQGVTFSIVRFPTPAEADKFYDADRQSYDVAVKAQAGTFQGKRGPWTLSRPIEEKTNNRVTLLREINDAGNKTAYYLDAGIYRGQFVIRFTGSGIGLERFRPAYKKAIEVIDERFPIE